ncbi:Coenzyme F420 hydrogenase/dehydrogenase, beta subunit C-terminal domain [Lysinibacillus mangiferihumi]|uniref:Coenzyme F420 hydrogenase/dehydrogenase, beta subunit C-terminal domain n=1 Tax=Lysinibacillus mangiferihumi TaxID=1130819 RepID=UPI00142E8837|nr:Coenzyme F420 hydrogenase/dehydrogenase, beta subunit C-terminal domain [Lysinibacillus mangiferihumi]
MTYLQLKEEIIDNDLCTSCGACVAVCPANIIQLNKNSIPNVYLDSKSLSEVCGSCNLCRDICPGKETDVPASELSLFGRTRTSTERWTGIINETNLVSVVDPNVRNHATAGGAVTGLLITALRSGLIDAALVIDRDKEKPWIPQAILTNDEETIIKCAQSTYCIAPNLHLLNDTRYESVGVVGLACEIQAIRKMQRNPETEALGKKIVFSIEIGCSSNTKLSGTEHLITDILNIPLDEVSDVRYRDGDYPGEFTVYTKNNESNSLPFFELVEEFKKFKTFRCLSCRDWWSGVADISVSDGDPNIYASSQYGILPSRFSMVATRTEIGQRLLELGILMGILVAEPTKFDPEESLGLQRKRFRSASYKRKYPNGVPDSSVLFNDNDGEREDDEVIAKMSNRIT